MFCPIWVTVFMLPLFCMYIVSDVSWVGVWAAELRWGFVFKWFIQKAFPGDTQSGAGEEGWGKRSSTGKMGLRVESQLLPHGQNFVPSRWTQALKRQLFFSVSCVKGAGPALKFWNILAWRCYLPSSYFSAFRFGSDAKHLILGIDFQWFCSFYLR